MNADVSANVIKPHRSLALLSCFAACVFVTAVQLSASPAFSTERSKSSNPVGYFEIPVTDMERAIRFYTALLGVTFEREKIDGYDMALFPFDPNGSGASGALAKGDVYVPSQTGPILYFRVDDIDAVLARALALGSMVLYPKKDIGPNGFVAEIGDSEGNRIALHMPRSK